MKKVKDFVASVFIVKDNKVLLVNHKLLNLWLPPGGHIEEYEEPSEAAIREIKEETGLDIELIGEEEGCDNVKILKQPILIQLEEIPLDSKRKIPHQHVDLIYFANIIGGSLKHNGKESNNIKWFSVDELNNFEIKEEVKNLALKAINML